jgi:HD-GYP domain-containing protein (c-di-GMP phosphodiesterase class II)
VEDALEEIRRQSGRQFDPRLTELFLGLGLEADSRPAGGARRTVAV